jgi:hypothetical protein
MVARPEGIKKDGIMGWSGFEVNVYNKLAYSGRRPEGTEKDCTGSHGSQQTVVLEDQNTSALH